MTTCPKCGHVRSATETAPDWQCPRCGIAYSKFAVRAATAASAPAATQAAHFRLDHESEALKSQRDAIQDTGQRGTPGARIALVYVTLAGLGFFAGGLDESGKAWIVTCAVIGVAAFAMWLLSWRKQRAFADVPTSRIASAAQGYVEIRGTVDKAPGCTLTGVLTRKPCVWFHYQVNERGTGSDEGTRTIESKAYSVPFVLRDETGECLVHPSGAEVTCEATDAWEKDRRTYIEAAIRPGDSIHVIGSFSTRATAPDENAERKTAELLKSWLAEPQEFFARFDADRDGRIGAQELARAREAARSELAARSVNQGGLHTLGKPKDGRPFLIFNASDHDDVVGGYATEVRFHLFVLIVALVFLAYNITR